MRAKVEQSGVLTRRTEMDAAARRLRAQIAAHARWAKHDPTEGTIAARDGFRERFITEAYAAAADRGETIDEAEARRRATHLLRAHMKRLALSKKRKRS